MSTPLSLNQATPATETAISAARCRRGAVLKGKPLSINRRRRLERLEARQHRGPSWQDPFPAAMALWAAFECDRAATKAGREFCRVPRREPAEPWDDETKAAFERQVREYDTMHTRLTAETPNIKPRSALPMYRAPPFRAAVPLPHRSQRLRA
jgi:hypothetical protein